jgi:hypothetical protein
MLWLLTVMGISFSELGSEGFTAARNQPLLNNKIKINKFTARHYLLTYEAYP